MGFYILLDAFKLSWVEYVYDDKDSTTLYQCKNMNNQLTVKSSSTGCTNENEEVTDHSEWIELLTRLDAAQSAEDIEDIFDVDQFLTEIAYEYLSGSWDHYLNFGHNFYMYKPKDDKWKFLLYDFDGELGQDISMGAGGGPGQFDASTPKTDSTDYPTYTFEEWAKPRHLIDILILKDSTRFDNILRNVVKKAFNPTVLFPHIDELKKFIRPYVELDKTPDENGKYPGRLNEKAGDYTLAQWEANSEFTKITSAQGFGQSYGLKYWILAKYRYVCKAYTIEDCDPVYLDENYEIPVDKEVEAKGDMTAGFPPFMQFKNKPTEPSTDNTDTSDDVEPPADNTDTSDDVEPPVDNTDTSDDVEPPADNTDTSDDVEPPADNTDLVVEPPAATDSIKPPTATTPAESLNCITKKPSDFIKKKCFAKKGSKSSIKSSEKSSYESEKTSDERENSSYESEKTSYESENTTDENENTSNESENTSDENENTSNESENTTDENENTSNESENTNDENENTSNESENTTDENENTSNESENTTDENENTSNESENTSDENENTSNESENTSDENENTSNESENTSDENENTSDDNENSSDESENPKIGIKDFKNIKNFFNKSGKSDKQSSNNKYGSNKSKSDKSKSNKSNSNKHDSKKDDSSKYNSNKQNSNKYDSSKYDSKKQDSSKYSSNKYDSKKQNSNKQDSDKKDKKNSFLQKIRNLFL